MEADTADALPESRGWLFEPKWDGFGSLVFRDGDEVRIQSKASKPLEHLFPDVAEAVRAARGEWQPPRPDLVVEVEYDHVSGGRFRHGTRFLRWRPDKDPRRCILEQMTR